MNSTSDMKDIEPAVIKGGIDLLSRRSVSSAGTRPQKVTPKDLLSDCPTQPVCPIPCVTPMANVRYDV